MKHGLLAAACALFTLFFGSRALAVTTIRQPGLHPSYVFEAEPHGIVGFDLPGKGKDASGLGLGLGFRGTVNILDRGFVKKINNSVGIGFGFDFLAPGSKNVAWVPVVMQWNFWISDKWSAFGEPGVGFYFGNASGIRPTFYAGARFHFTDNIALTLRAGYPSISVGVSFLL